MSETYTSDSEGVREAARALVESGKALPTAGDATTSSATDNAWLRTYEEGRIAADGTDKGVGLRAAARALAEERKAANELLAEMEAPQLAAAREIVDNARATVAQIEADPIAAAASLEADKQALANIVAGYQTLQQENEALKAAGSVSPVPAQAAAVYQGQGYLAAVHAGLLQQFQAQFPEFVGKDAGVVMAELQQTDTLRAKHAQATWELLNALFVAEEQKVAAQAQRAQLAYEAWAKVEDLKFAELIGGPPDPQLAKDAIDLLTNVLGVPAEDVAKMWNTPVGFPLRDARAQVILSMAARFARAQANYKAEQIKPEKPPAVTQRPGAAGTHVSSREWEMKGLIENAARSESLRDWAKVRAAERRARRK